MGTERQIWAENGENVCFFVQWYFRLQVHKKEDSLSFVQSKGLIFGV